MAIAPIKLFGLLILSFLSFAEAKPLLEVINTKPDLPLEFFLKSVEEKLPRNFSWKIPHPVQIEFKDLGGNLHSLLSCQKNHQIVAYTQRGFLHSRFKITLSHLILKIISNRDLHLLKSCAHGNALRFAQATLIHELGHVYDFSGNFYLPEQQDIDSCKNSQDNSTLLVSFSSCAAAQTAQGRISESSRYRRHMGWKEKEELFSSPRSPDRYEFQSVKEHFAVNFEYYILDADYQCRRPHTFAFFQNIFGHIATKDCRGYKSVLEEQSGERIELNSERIFEIQYLQAGKGEAFMSRWGHAMFRLVVCAPHRNTVDEECRKDIDHHLVVGFGATTTSGGFNNWLGLIGKYPMRISILPFSQQVAAYTDEEFRSVASFTLHLTQAQKNLFVQNVIQQFWEYQGRYRFISNNCASESFRFLRTILPSSHALQSGMIMEPLTPDGLQDLLRRYSIIENSSKEVIPSKETTLQAALQTLPLPTPRTLDGYLKSSSQERFELFSLAKNKQHLAAFYLLERWIGKKKQADILDRALLQLEKSSAQNLQLPHYLEIVLKNLPSGYGVPEAFELLKPEEVRSVRNNRDQILTEVIRKMTEEMKINEADVNQIKVNLKLLQDRLISPGLH